MTPTQQYKESQTKLVSKVYNITKQFLIYLMIYLMTVCLLMVLPLLLIGLLIGNTRDYRNNQPCEYFKNEKTKDMPARCLKYYQDKK